MTSNGPQMDLKCPSTGALKLANHRKPIWSTLFTKAVSFSRGAEVPLFPMFWKVLTEVYALETWWLDGFLVFSRSNLFLTGSKPIWGASSVSKTIAYKRSPPKGFETSLKPLWKGFEMRSKKQRASISHFETWSSASWRNNLSETLSDIPFSALEKERKNGLKRVWTVFETENSTGSIRWFILQFC